MCHAAGYSSVYFTGVNKFLIDFTSSMSARKESGVCTIGFGELYEK